MEKEKDLTIQYWVSSPYASIQDKLIKRLKSGRPVTGFSFPLLDTKCVAVCVMADHGNEAFRAAVGVIASEQDGQPRP
eukprot:11212734-Ditylum_brightwellii.AAC.1